MKKLKKLILLLLIIFATCFFAGVIFTFTYEKAVIHYLKKFLDKHLTTEIVVSKINFSVFRKFPHASVELRNILVKSSLGLSFRDFGGMDTDTLLYAKSVLFEFSIPAIVKGDYKIKNISIEDGELNLYTDRNAKNNYSIWNNEGNKVNGSSRIRFQNILLSNVAIRYLNLSKHIDILTRSKKVNLTADIGEKSSIQVNGNIYIKKILIKEMVSHMDNLVSLDFGMNFTKTDFIFSKSYFQSGKSRISFSGKITKSKRQRIDLVFGTKNASLKDIAGFFSEKLKKFNANYTPSGAVFISGSVKGIINKGNKPQIDINFKVQKGSVNNKNNQRKVTDISISGTYLSGPSGAQLKINDFSSRSGNSLLNGSFQMTGLTQPYVELSMKSEIDFREFSEFANLDTIENISGSVKTDIKLTGQLPTLGKVAVRDILALNREGSLQVNDIFFTVKNSRFRFEKMNGLIYLGSTVQLREYSFLLAGSDFSMNCNLSNIDSFLIKKGNLFAEAEIHSANFDLKELIEKDQKVDTTEFVKFPDNLFLKTNFTVDKLVYGKFSATNISGAVSYEPTTFHIHSFQLNTEDGLMTGTATVDQNTERITRIDCNVNLTKINIQKLFYSMNNFTQDFILDKNIRGKISGIINFTTSWDKKVNLLPNTIEANADIEISNGQIVDFEPMLGLSKYIAVEELKNVKFSTLKNQIIIKDQTVIIPEMEIHSNAFNIKGSGTHTFDNSFDYRILVELSELLARKARKKKTEMNEFGIEETDGRGGLKVPIKIVGKGDKFEVNIDKKKAFSLIKKNVSDEKVELKSLLKNEKSLNDQQQPDGLQNKKFIIDWDEGDDKKDFIFEKEEPVKKQDPQFIIDWDDADDSKKNDSLDFLGE